MLGSSTGTWLHVKHQESADLFIYYNQTASESFRGRICCDYFSCNAVSVHPNSFCFRSCTLPCSSSISFESGYCLQISTIRHVKVIVVDSSNQIRQVWEVSYVELERQYLHISASSFIMLLQLHAQASSLWSRWRVKGLGRELLSEEMQCSHQTASRSDPFQFRILLWRLESAPHCPVSALWSRNQVPVQECSLPC